MPSMRMNSRKFGFLKKMFSLPAVVIALLGLVALASPARADIFSMCGSAATAGGFGFTSSINGCAQTVSIPATSDYGKFTWDSSSTGYPGGLQLGNLGGIDAHVVLTAQPGDQPFFMLAFTDATDGLGQGAATDQILMIQFQPPPTVSGNDMVLDPNASLFNLYDNTTNAYLAGGQADTHTLEGWLAADPFLTTEAVQEIRIGMGLAPGGSNPESLTVNSLDVNQVPEPTSLLLLLTAAGATVLGIRHRQPGCRRG